MDEVELSGVHRPWSSKAGSVRSWPARLQRETAAQFSKPYSPWHCTNLMCSFVYCRYGKLAFFQGGSAWQVLGVCGEGLSLSLWTCLFWTFHIHRITQHVAFLSGFFHLASRFQGLSVL